MLKDLYKQKQVGSDGDRIGFTVGADFRRETERMLDGGDQKKKTTTQRNWGK